MPRTTTEEMSSGDARDEILSQHSILRDLLADVMALAETAAAEGRELRALRERARSLYEALAAHMTFEEHVLPAALRDVIGWGAVIRERMETDHATQREVLATAISELEPDGLSGPALIGSVRAFVAMVFADMETEEADLLRADVDALAGDSLGG